MTRRLRVVYWNNQPTPYVVARLNAVAAGGQVDLQVWFDQMREPDRSWDVRTTDWLFDWRMVDGRTLLGRTVKLPMDELRETRPDVMVCNYDRAHMALGALASRTLAGRVCLRVLPAYGAQSTITVLKACAWHVLFRAVDGAKVPGPDGTRFAARHGLPAARCWPVTQSIDVDLYGRARALRSRPVTWPYRFVTVSRMVPSKGIDVLLASWRTARNALPGATLTLVGDGSDEARYRRESEDMPEVRWLGFRQPEELPDVLAEQDVLVFPTLGDPNGLVVEEAMAAGLPVLSSDAAGDIRSRIPQGEAGWIVPAGDVEALAAELVDVGQLPPDAVAGVGTANAERAQNFVPRHYADDFADFCRNVYALPRRRSLAGTVATLVSWAVRGLWLLARPSAAVGRGTADVG